MKKMISVKIDETLIEPFKQITETTSRSQGGQIEFWIKEESKRLKIKIEPADTPIVKTQKNPAR